MPGRNSWVQEPFVNAFWAGTMGYQYIKSFDSLKVTLERNVNENEMPEVKVDKEIKEIFVSGNLATVFLEEERVWDYAGVQNEFTMLSTYILQKVDKKWKFVSTTTFNKSSYDNNDSNSEWNINREGYHFLIRGELDKAIKIFELNSELYPEAFNTWDSLAEAYMEKGDHEKAIEYYRKSLELNPENEHAVTMIEKMETEK